MWNGRSSLLPLVDCLILPFPLFKMPLPTFKYEVILVMMDIMQWPIAALASTTIVRISSIMYDWTSRSTGQGDEDLKDINLEWR